MSWRGNDENRDDGDEAEDELDEANYKTHKDAVIFAIDVSKSMMKPPPGDGGKKKADADSAILTALKCAYQIMQQRIIAQPKDMMGVLLFGTDKSKFRGESAGRSGYPHCYLFIDLDVPSAEDVKTLRSLAEGDDEDLEDILTPSDELVIMSNVLFCANQIFTTNAPNFGSRRLFLITDNDDPHAGDKQARSAAAVRAKDLFDLGVTIELFPVTHEDEKFNMNKFYEDIVYRDSTAESDTSEELKLAKAGDGLSLLNSLISNINSKQTPKRSYFSHMPFDIAPGLTITVKGYQVVHRQVPARSCYVWMEGETAQLATGETTKLESESTRTVEKSEVKKAYKFGGEYVYFNPEELKGLKDFGKPCLRIIGFKDKMLLPTWASVKKSTFIFPSEEDYVGSTRVFSALWQKMWKDNKMALAWHIARINANPVLVAIVASKGPEDPETGDESSEEKPSGTPYLPAGLWLHPLPFADDLRNVDLTPTSRCSDDLINQMRKVVQNLQLPKAIYNPMKYPNPTLQWHYRIIQAIALDEEMPEQPDDATIPRYRAINKRVGGYLQDWGEAVAEEAKGLMGTRAVKREADLDDDHVAKPAAKRAKAAPKEKKLAGGMSNAQLKAASDGDTLKKMTVAELKDVLASKGVSATGKKAELVARLEEWVEENT